MTRLFAGTPWDRPPVCDRCGQLETECTCPPPVPVVEIIPPSKQTARLSLEKRKKGKIVTVVRGLPGVGNDLPALLARLKTTCGAGGTLDGDDLEIQGNHLDRIREQLDTLGYNVRR